MGWIPVVRGLYSAKEQRDVDALGLQHGVEPGRNRVAVRAEHTVCQPESWPKSAAHCIQAG